uniref:Swt1-like HEPN domain-containing protein n=1 Tax=Candidatus Methanogaster sp. ANME-2c ERB4 TaxID=2759911 RepID=A0A7G9YGB0_9EURY|nr:hypothetical protein NBCJMJBN_00005 [Methanosarcinales archaeon ANME-2c ERB4]
MSEQKKTVGSEKVEFGSLYGNERLMKEIEEKVKSGKKEDAIESLILFEKNWKALPNGPARDFIYNMRENEDNKIKRMAEEIYGDSLKEMDEKVRKNIENMTKSFNASFLPIHNQMKELSRAFDISKQMADIAKTIPRIPSVAFDIYRLQPKLKELAEFRNNLKETVTKHVTDTQRITTPLPMLPSPMLRAEYLFSKVSDSGLESKKSLSEVLERDEEEIEHEIQFIFEQDKDSIFNFEAYKYLYGLERYLRSLIQIKIIEPNENIENKIPPEMMAGWESRKKKEEGSHVTDGNYELIDYSDFTDLKHIFGKGKNKELFKDIINPELFKAVLTKLDELDHIRKKIAHSRPLSKKEFDRLIRYTEDISKIFKD